MFWGLRILLEFAESHGIKRISKIQEDSDGEVHDSIFIYLGRCRSKEKMDLGSNGLGVRLAILLFMKRSSVITS